jgi:hypothetical protein
MDLLVIGLLLLAVIFLILIHITNISARSEISQVDRYATAARNIGLWISILEMVVLVLLIVNIIFHITEYPTNLKFWIPIVSAVLVLISCGLSIAAATNYRKSDAYEEDDGPYKKFLGEIVLNILTVISVIALVIFGFLKRQSPSPVVELFSL